MACKGATKKQTVIVTASNDSSENIEATKRTKILFGVDSEIQTNDLLQNNITEFEWAVRNKIYPTFWGRNLTGENCLTKEEIEFIRQKGCRIAAIYNDLGEKQTEEQGKLLVKDIVSVVSELDIPSKTAIFLQVSGTALRNA